MKVLVCLLLVAAVSASPAVDSYELALLKNSMDELMREFLEYVRWLLQRHEPYSFPPLPEQHLVDEHVDLKFSTSNVKLSKAETFTIDKIYNNVPKLQSSFVITVPQAHLEGDYVVSGTAFNKKVQGTGTFSVDIDHFVQSADNQFTIVDHSLQLQDAKIDYKIGGAKFNVDGLSIEGRSKEEMEDFLNKSFLNYLEEHKAVVVEKVANHAKNVINKELKGHSLQDVIDFMKKMVASTPDPPPFPF